MEYIKIEAHLIQKRIIAEQVIIYITEKMNFEMQAYIRNCESYLTTPDNIQPNSLAQYFYSYSSFGINDQITSLIQRYFYFNLNHYELLRYIQLLDRLIKYSFPLPHSFINMYAQCFVQSVQNGRRGIQEELKILRKIWTVYLNDDLIENLRTEVYKFTRIDVDCDLKNQSKKFLQQYFLNNFIPQKQINQILYKNKPIKLPNHHIGKPPVQAQAQWNNQKPKKRHRFSEETECQMKQNQPKKEIPNGQKALMILNNLRNMNNFCCRECGKYFQTQKAYQNHKQQHFEQRMKNFKQKRDRQSLKRLRIGRKNGRKQLKLQQWTKQNQLQNTLKKSNFIIGIGQELEYSKVCNFCSRQFDINIIDDSFVYQDTIRVSIQTELNTRQNSVDLMHTYCYKQLISSRLS